MIIDCGGPRKVRCIPVRYPFRTMAIDREPQWHRIRVNGKLADAEYGGKVQDRFVSAYQETIIIDFIIEAIEDENN